MSNQTATKTADVANSSQTETDLERKLRELRDAATRAGLDCRGSAEILRRRLRYQTQQSIHQAYRYLLVLDFEATCESHNPDGYQHEIIEFPLVLIDLQASAVIDKFHTYCRPKLHPKLSDFCRKFTGIEQEIVDSAPRFPAALAAVEAWLQHSGALKHPLALATDCQADVATFLRLQCSIDSLPVPVWARHWINLRITFQRHYGFEKKLNLSGMLAALGLTFEGRPHCGLDDADNIARVALALASDGCRLLVNQRLDPGRSPHYWRPVNKNEAEAQLTTSSNWQQRRVRRQASPASLPESTSAGLDEETDDSINDLIYLLNLRGVKGASKID